MSKPEPIDDERLAGVLEAARHSIQASKSIGLARQYASAVELHPDTVLAMGQRIVEAEALLDDVLRDVHEILDDEGWYVGREGLQARVVKALGLKP